MRAVIWGISERPAAASSSSLLVTCGSRGCHWLEWQKQTLLALQRSSRQLLLCCAPKELLGELKSGITTQQFTGIKPATPERICSSPPRTGGATG